MISICQRSHTLSEAGRKLFHASRQSKKITNDADPLRKYLARFGLDWQRLQIHRDSAAERIADGQRIDRQALTNSGIDHCASENARGFSEQVPGLEDAEAPGLEDETGGRF